MQEKTTSESKNPVVYNPEIRTDQLEKGDRVLFKSGWYATVMDNRKKGHIRLMRVEGYDTEMGSVYVWDFKERVEKDGSRTPIRLSTKQIATSVKVAALLRALPS